MKNYGRNIRPHVDRELQAAADAGFRGEPAAAFAHLERAHVLGQASTVEHVRVHWQMLRWGWRHKNLRECRGQLMRIAGAATKTAIGWVPHGNTGGSGVSPFRRMAVQPELEAIMLEARATRAEQHSSRG